MTETIQQLQATWKRITGQEVHPIATERLFYEVAKIGFTDDDLRCVLEYMMRFNRQNSGAKFRINCSKVLGQTEDFASIVAESRAKERNRKAPPTARQAVLQQFRPQVGEQTETATARTFKDVMKAIE